jgi:phosphoserine phosphatase
MKIPQENLETLGNINIIREQMEYSILESIDKMQKMVIFNLDEAIFMQDYLELAAAAFDSELSLMQIREHYSDPITILEHTASLFRDRNLAELLEVADAIPVVPDIKGVVDELKKRGYACGIITDGFECVARHIKNKLGMDFVFANRLHLYDSVATGELTIPEYFLQQNNGDALPQYSKNNILGYITEKYHVTSQNVIYVGSGADGSNLLRDAGIGVVFDSQAPGIEKIADKLITGPYLSPLLSIAQASPERKFRLKLPSVSKKQARRIGIGSLVVLASAGLVYLAARQLSKKQAVTDNC